MAHASCLIPSLLRDLCTTLATNYAQNDNDDVNNIAIPATSEELIRQFPSFLGLATAHHPLVLFLDAVDQLHDAQEDVAWLPATLPPHVHLVVSATKGAAVTAWRAAHSAIQVVDLAPLDPASMAMTLTGLLADNGRTLQPEQYERVLAHSIASGLPLYLRLAAEEARSWRSWQVGADQLDLPADVPGLLLARFGQLEAPASHGHVLVEHALGLLGAAKDGLAEDELLEVLSQDQATRDVIIHRTPHAPEVDQVPVVLWARLFFDLEALLTEREQDGARLISFYHQEVGEVVRARYLNGEQGLARHAELARYFAGQPVASAAGVPNLRKLAEQPAQEAGAGLWEMLHTTLTDTSFLEAQIRRAGVAAVIADFALLPDDAIIRDLASAARSGVVVLGQAPEEVWNQVHGRLGMGASLHASAPRNVPRFELRFSSFLPADEALVRVFSGHTSWVNGCAFSPDGRQAVSASDDQSLRLWDVASGSELCCWTTEATVDCCAFHLDGGMVIAGDSFRGVHFLSIVVR